MKSIIFKSLFFATISAGLFSGCANDDSYNAPNAECTEPNLTATKTVQEFLQILWQWRNQLELVRGDRMAQVCFSRM